MGHSTTTPDEVATTHASVDRGPRVSIRRKIFRRIVLVVLVPTVLVGAAGIYAVYTLSESANEGTADARARLAEDVVSTDLATRAEQVTRELVVFLTERVDDLRDVAQDQAIVDAIEVGDVDRATIRLATFDSNSTDYLRPILTDESGRVVVGTGAEGEIVTDEDWYQDAVGSRMSLEGPRQTDEGRIVVDVAIPIRAGSASVLRAELSLTPLQGITDAVAEAAGERDVRVFTTEGLLLADTTTGHAPETLLDPGSAVTDDPVAAESLEFVDSTENSGALLLSDVAGGFSYVEQPLLQNRILDGDVAFSNAAVGVFDWVVVVEQPAEVAFAPLAGLESLESDIASSRDLLSRVVIVLVGLAFLGAVVAAVLLGRRLAGPIVRLRDAATRASRERLPELVSAVEQGSTADDLPELEPIREATGDEIEELAESLDLMQSTAADLATAQARLRRQNVATAFVSMGRRNQNLLSRQLEHLDELERGETDPDTLERLFRLDQLATRMRRNAESLLVMAGQDPPRRFDRPVSLRSVVQAAMAEIEDFRRVELVSLDDGGVDGSVASSLAHLVAELLDNAARFSPPSTPVEVFGSRHTDEGYRLVVRDHGLGIEPGKIDDLNEALARPRDFGDAPSSFLGLFVVAHLARRHGFDVRLQSTGQGTAAVVVLPASLLVDLPAPRPVEAPAPPPAPVTAPTPVVSAAPGSEAMHGGPVGAAPAAPVAPALAGRAPEVGPVPGPAAHERPGPGVGPVPGPAVDERSAGEELPRRRRKVSFDSPGSWNATPSRDRTSAETEPPADVVPAEPAPSPAPVVPSTTHMGLEPPRPGLPTRRPEPVPGDRDPAAEPGFFNELHARRAPATPAPVSPTSTPAGPPLDTQGGPGAETTPSGFRKRTRGASLGQNPQLAPTVAPGPAGSAGPVATRSPEEVRRRLSRYRQGVDAGRHESDPDASEGEQP